MARAKKAASDEHFFDLEPTAEGEDLLLFLEELGPTAATIDIYRMPAAGQGGRRPFVDTIPSDALHDNPLLYIRDSYGPGKYMLQFRDSSRKIRGSKVIEIDPKTVGVPSSNGHTAPAGSFEQQHINLLREQNEKQQTLLMALLASNRGPDIGALMTGMGAIMGAMKQGPTFDPAAQFAAITTAFTQLRGPAQVEDGMEKALKLIGIARDIMNPDSAVPDNPWTLLKEVGREVVARIQIPATAGVPGAAAAPVDVTPVFVPPAGNATVLPPADQPANGGAKMMPPQQVAQLIKDGIQYLKMKAAASRDVGLYVDYIFENEDEPQWAAIVGCIRQGVTFDQLLQFDPEIAGNEALRVWFAALYRGLHDGVFNSVDSGGGPGNPDNPGNNAGAGPQG